MSYEEDMRNLLSDVPDEFEPLQRTVDVWMDLPEPEVPPEEPAPEPEPDTSPATKKDGTPKVSPSSAKEPRTKRASWLSA